MAEDAQGSVVELSKEDQPEETDVADGEMNDGATAPDDDEGQGNDEDAAVSVPLEIDGPADDDQAAAPQLEGCGLPVAEGGGVLSPLSGAYLLIVLAEPISERHKVKMIQKLRQGLLSWDVSSSHVDLSQELATITEAAPPGEETKGGERLIQFATEHLVTEVLIQPQMYTLQQCVKNMLGSFTKHRHIVHGGYTFAGSGAWLLQDGAYSYNDFVEPFDEYEIQRVMRAYENSISINIHCCAEGEWTQEHLNGEQFSELCQVKLNASEVIQEGNSVDAFLQYLEPFLVPQSIQQLLPPSDVVGNIRFSHPTLYVFPGGQGDSALFGINGFNLLVDGGFSRKACFWDFSRHLDRLDAILITRLSDDNTGGMSALLQRKAMHAVYPQIGHIFANLPHKEISNTNCISSTLKDQSKAEHSDDEDDEGDSLIINVIEEGNSMIQNLQILNLQPQVCLRDKDASCKPINLYHKVGHGKLDMYVINPARDAKEVKEFMERWTSENSKTIGTFKSGINVDGKELWLPLANLVSICALLVWFPDNPDDTITRLLFPGSTPQHKVIRGLDKLKDLEFMQKPVCSSGSYRQKESKEKMDVSKPSYKPASVTPASRKLIKKDPAGKSLEDSLNASKESIEKTELNKRMESVSTRRSASNKPEENKVKDDLKNTEEKESKLKKLKEDKEIIEKKQEREKKIRQQIRDKSESKPHRKKIEEKDIKEEKNKAAGALQKEKVSALTREKHINTSRTKLPETSRGLKAKTDSLEKVSKRSTASSANSSKPTSQPPSKVKKEATNKTKKEEVIRSKKDSEIKVKPVTRHPKETKVKDTKLSGKSIGTTVAAAATLTAAAVLADNVLGQDEENESIVEKHQIEPMETSPTEDFQQNDIQQHYTKDDDDIEPELERIKDDEDDVQDVRIPDIPGEVNPNIPDDDVNHIVNQEINVPKDLVLPDRDSIKPVVQHVKTPDEVDDLPEHEAVEPDGNVLEIEDISNDLEVEVEEKIALDLQEKEQVEKKEEEEAKEQALKISPESDGAEEQRELGEVIISAHKIPIASSYLTEEPIEEELHLNLTNGDTKKHLEDVEKSNASEKEESSKKDEDNIDVLEFQLKELEDKFRLEIEALLIVLKKLEEVFIEESTAVISSSEPDENVIKAIACKVNRVHEITQECDSISLRDELSKICILCEDSEALVKRCMKQAIEIIEMEAPGFEHLTKALHMEADLVLQCQEVKSSIILLHDTFSTISCEKIEETKENSKNENENDQANENMKDNLHSEKEDEIDENKDDEIDENQDDKNTSQDEGQEMKQDTDICVPEETNKNEQVENEEIEAKHKFVQDEVEEENILPCHQLAVSEKVETQQITTEEEECDEKDQLDGKAEKEEINENDTAAETKDLDANTAKEKELEETDDTEVVEEEIASTHISHQQVEVEKYNIVAVDDQDNEEIQDAAIEDQVAKTNDGTEGEQIAVETKDALEDKQETNEQENANANEQDSDATQDAAICEKEEQEINSATQSEQENDVLPEGEDEQKKSAIQTPDNKQEAEETKKVLEDETDETKDVDENEQEEPEAQADTSGKDPEEPELGEAATADQTEDAVDVENAAETQDAVVAADDKEIDETQNAFQAQDVECTGEKEGSNVHDDEDDAEEQKETNAQDTAVEEKQEVTETQAEPSVDDQEVAEKKDDTAQDDHEIAATQDTADEINQEVLETPEVVKMLDAKISDEKHTAETAEDEDKETKTKEVTAEDGDEVTETREVTAEVEQEETETKEDSAENEQEETETKEDSAVDEHEETETKEVAARDEQEETETKENAAEGQQEENETNEDTANEKQEETETNEVIAKDQEETETKEDTAEDEQEETGTKENAADGEQEETETKEDTANDKQEETETNEVIAKDQEEEKETKQDAAEDKQEETETKEIKAKDEQEETETTEIIAKDEQEETETKEDTDNDKQEETEANKVIAKDQEEETETKQDAAVDKQEETETKENAAVDDELIQETQDVSVKEEKFAESQDDGKDDQEVVLQGDELEEQECDKVEESPEAVDDKVNIEVQEEEKENLESQIQDSNEVEEIEEITKDEKAEEKEAVEESQESATEEKEGDAAVTKDDDDEKDEKEIEIADNEVLKEEEVAVLESEDDKNELTSDQNQVQDEQDLEGEKEQNNEETIEKESSEKIVEETDDGNKAIIKQEDLELATEGKESDETEKVDENIVEEETDEKLIQANIAKLDACEPDNESDIDNHQIEGQDTEVTDAPEESKEQEDEQCEVEDHSADQESDGKEEKQKVVEIQESEEPEKMEAEEDIVEAVESSKQESPEKTECIDSDNKAKELNEIKSEEPVDVSNDDTSVKVEDNDNNEEEDKQDVASDEDGKDNQVIEEPEKLASVTETKTEDENADSKTNPDNIIEPEEKTEDVKEEEPNEKEVAHVVEGLEEVKTITEVETIIETNGDNEVVSEEIVTDETTEAKSDTVLNDETGKIDTQDMSDENIVQSDEKSDMEVVNVNETLKDAEVDEQQTADNNIDQENNKSAEQKNNILEDKSAEESEKMSENGDEENGIECDATDTSEKRKKPESDIKSEDKHPEQNDVEESKEVEAQNQLEEHEDEEQQSEEKVTNEDEVQEASELTVVHESKEGNQEEEKEYKLNECVKEDHNEENDIDSNESLKRNEIHSTLCKDNVNGATDEKAVMEKNEIPQVVEGLETVEEIQSHQTIDNTEGGKVTGQPADEIKLETSKIAYELNVGETQQAGSESDKTENEQKLESAVVDLCLEEKSSISKEQVCEKEKVLTDAKNIAIESCDEKARLEKVSDENVKDDELLDDFEVLSRKVDEANELIENDDDKDGLEVCDTGDCNQEQEEDLKRDSNNAKEKLDDDSSAISIEEKLIDENSFYISHTKQGSTSIMSDSSEQEIPPTSPRSDVTFSPENEGAFTSEITTECSKIIHKFSEEKALLTEAEEGKITQGESHLEENKDASCSLQKISEAINSELATDKSHGGESVIQEDVIVDEESYVVVSLAQTEKDTSLSNIKEDIETKDSMSKEKPSGQQEFLSAGSEDNLLADTESVIEISMKNKKQEKTQDQTQSVEGQKNSDLKESSLEESSSLSSEATTSAYSDLLLASTKTKTTTTVVTKIEKLDAEGNIIESSTIVRTTDSEEMEHDDASEIDIEKSSSEKVAAWGKPLGLPSPANPALHASSNRNTSRTRNATEKQQKSKERIGRGDRKISPVYMDLAYVPHHGDSNYSDIEFFKKVRARYYVFSGVEPSKEVLNALLEAKMTWENKELEVTIIPTYDSDVLGYWVAENEEALMEHKIDLAPSASRCTINLQDHETSCAAYRLEF